MNQKELREKSLIIREWFENGKHQTGFYIPCTVCGEHRFMESFSEIGTIAEEEAELGKAVMKYRNAVADGMCCGKFPDEL